MPRQFDVPEDVIKNVVDQKWPPSAYSEYMVHIHAKHVIGINNAYQIGPWIDILFFGDYSWYLIHRKTLAKWPKLKASCSPRFDSARRDAEGIKYVQKDHDCRRGISRDQRKVAWNANSGAAAISLAAHLGAKRIILLGFDMHMQDGATHWHGGHLQKNPKRRTPPFSRHLKGFPVIAKDAKEMGIEILNASPTSKIKDFRKINIKEILN